MMDLSNPCHRIIVALDVPDASEAEQFLSRWETEEKPFIKVGMQLFYATGPSWVATLVERGYPVFLDVKLHDIPNTVSGAIGSLVKLGVDMITLHASGGRAMMEAAREAAEASGGRKRPALLGVTQLTSTDEQMLNGELGIPGTVRDSVLNLAQLAEKSGMDGVVCSGEEAGWMKEHVSGKLLTVTPGIRLKGEDAGDQKRVMTPEVAIQSGADLLVMGRSITQSSQPVSVWKQCVKSIQRSERKS